MLPGGSCPTKEFLDCLNKKDELPFVLREIDLLQEFGNQLRRPHVDYLEDGIYELRIPVKHKQYRLLYFYFYQEKIIISHGLRKEAKVKTADIEKAKKHKADYFARHERES
jgi:phage-related protein